MALHTTRTVLIPVLGVGTIRITPRKGRRYSISAPQALEILDRRGRKLDFNRKRPDKPKM